MLLATQYKSLYYACFPQTTSLRISGADLASYLEKNDTLPEAYNTAITENVCCESNLRNSLVLEWARNAHYIKKDVKPQGL